MEEDEPPCNHTWIINTDYLWCCSNCGLCTDTVIECVDRGRLRGHEGTGVQRQTYINFGQAWIQEDGGTDKGKSKGLVGFRTIHGKFPGVSTYFPKYHLNERMAQVLLIGPEVPENIICCLAMFYYQSLRQNLLPPVDKLSKIEIAWLCNRCPVPYDFETYYQSTKLKKNYLTSFTRYAERWYYIRERLGATPFIKPTKKQWYALTLNALLAQEQWECIRHTEECQNHFTRTGERNRKCHLKAPEGFGCRKNFLPFYYLLHQICILLNYMHLLPLFPVTNKKKTITNLNSLWKDTCERLSWKYIPLVTTEGNKKKTLKRRKTTHYTTRRPRPHYTLRRMKKRRKRLYIRQQRNPLIHHKRKQVLLNLRKSKKQKKPFSKEEDAQILVYDIGDYFSCRTQEETNH